VDKRTSEGGRPPRPPNPGLEPIIARSGKPTLAHYRAVYESIGVDWPGDDEIRRLYPVADGGG
jgi:hypothetical protein